MWTNAGEEIIKAIIREKCAELKLESSVDNEKGHGALGRTNGRQKPNALSGPILST